MITTPGVFILLGLGVVLFLGIALGLGFLNRKGS